MIWLWNKTDWVYGSAIDNQLIGKYEDVLMIHNLHTTQFLYVQLKSSRYNSIKVRLILQNHGRYFTLTKVISNCGAQLCVKAYHLKSKDIGN